jgi:hypothetical protein
MAARRVRNFLKPKIPSSEFEIDLYRQFIVGALSQWRLLTSPLSVFVRGAPDAQGQFEISASPFGWIHERTEEQPTVQGEAWIIERFRKPLVCWRLPQQPHILHAQEGDSSSGPRVDWAIGRIERTPAKRSARVRT